MSLARAAPVPARSSRHFVAVAGAALVVWQGGAAAQTDAAPAAAPTATPAPAPAAAAPDSAAYTILFSADLVDYDQRADVVTASGAVNLQRDGVQLRADAVRWDRTSGAITANGNVAITSPDAAALYGDSITLTDSLRDGAMENLLLVIDNGARLAARRGTRQASGNIDLERAVYSPYPVDEFTRDGVYRPRWQIRAVEVRYDVARDRIAYRGAQLELFGLPLIPLPGLSHQASNRGASGLLVPDIRIDRVNGLELATPYYLRLADNRDLTITPHIYSAAAPMLTADYRALTARGAYRISGHATYSSVVPVDGQAGATSGRARLYLDGAGRFQLDDKWTIDGSVRVASDRTFLRRYDISRDDRLRSVISAERNGGSSYLSIAGWAVQTLRVNDAQGQQPIALPLIDFRQRLADPVVGGQIELQLNSLAIARSAGQDTRRAFASARWDLRRLTGMGQQITATALVRGDIYHSADNGLTTVAGYRGQPGVQGRGIAAVAVDASWPLIGTFAGGTQQLTPRIQVVAAPPVDNIRIPNEDSRAFDLEDSNIFALNRFAGYDRFEDGIRISYGIDWQVQRPGLKFEAMIAQSYRLSSKPQLFPGGTGLADRQSDIVGRTTVAWRDIVRLTHRYRLDKDNLAVRRNEVDATIGSRRNYLLLGYLRLNRDITALDEDLQDREELRLGGRMAFARYWSAYGSAIVDLTSPSESPLSTGNGFQPVRHRVGVAYDDGYLNIGLTWRRDYQDTGDARRGNSYILQLGFRNLGF